MDEQRIAFHNLLVAALQSSNVYFQPPSNILMQYPCIVYTRSNIEAKFADDIMYSAKTKYTVTLIDPNPDASLTFNKLLSFPLVRFERHFTVDGLNHDVFSIYH